MNRIVGGYILKARSIQRSKISKYSPCVREVWDWLLMNASYEDQKNIKRGQLFCRYSDIIEDLAWYAGYRKETYNLSSVKRAMSELRKELMIDTTNEPHGTLVTLRNYSFFQDPKNYERTNERTNERTTERVTNEPLYNKKKEEEKKYKKEKYKKEKNLYTKDFEEFWSYYPNRGNHPNNKMSAYRQRQARLKQHLTPQQMITGSKNYQLYCNQINRTGTEMVMLASTFLGRDKHFMDYQQPKEIKQNAGYNQTKTAAQHGADVTRWITESD
jgi:hypothetical protein